MIDQLKNHGLTFDEINNHELEEKSKGKLSLVYKFYQERLKVYNAVDFGDLILIPLQIFRAHVDILEIYQEKFRYILVDEYQDTNSAQYMFLRLLSGEKKIFVVLEMKINQFMVGGEHNLRIFLILKMILKVQ